MNIWVFNHYATTPSNVGGTRHYDLASALLKEGHRVTIFASSFNHFEKRETRAYDQGASFCKETINGIDFIWIKTANYHGTVKRLHNILNYTFRGYRAAKKELMATIPDIVIGSSVHPLAAYIAYRIAKRAKKPFYFEERDLWPQTFVDFGKLSRNNPIARLLYFFERHLYLQATKIIVLFDKAIDYVVSRNIDRNKVIHIPNGVVLDNYNTMVADTVVAQAIQSYPYTVIYTGSHGIANHLEPLIETAKLLRDHTDIHFLLVGDGLEKNNLIRLAQGYQLQNVTFLHPIPKEKIPYLLSLADLSFISMKKSPLYQWGFSMNKLYDYMASGLPIMMHASKEIVGDFSDIDGVTLAETPAQLAQQILQRIYDDDYKLNAGNSLKDYVEKNYSWEKLALRLESHMQADCNQGVTHA
ncbi:glycosyltransferase family 4 protein [Dehalobacter sp. DCM]|uniref:glycosyltransferase family 4 protein n=1 Tax=Dehalobacter sp. DCM TaxID=2907827 RepID=UPI0030818FF3|nr:glycosyltransferase family 4 protein [Dehalobacter sp. DCM]